MGRLVHFEIHASDPHALKSFYEELFGWTFTKWDNPAMEYWLIKTGDDKEPGINGGMVGRMGDAPQDGAAVNAFVCTADVDDVEASMKKALDLKGRVAVPKMPVPGVGWLAYVNDPDGNIVGLMQRDPSAK